MDEVNIEGDGVDEAYTAWAVEQEELAHLGGGSLYRYLKGYDERGDIRRPWPADVAAIMRDGAPPVEMLVDGWLVAGELHALYGAASTAKTWLALWLAIRVMEDGGRVVYFDEELGHAEVAKRLLLLGANPDAIEDRFLYFPYPGWGRAPADLAGHEALLSDVEDLRLVVYDTMTDMLAESGLDENKNIEVTQWVKWFCEPARRLGAAQIVCDHTGHAGETQRGATAKRAKGKVQWYLSVKKGKESDAETVGEVRVQLRKNTRGAPLPKDRLFEIGGGNDVPGAFTFSEIEGKATTPEDGDRAGNVLQDVVAAVRAHGPLSVTQVKGLVRGKSQAITDALRNGVSLGTLTVETRGRSLIYAPAPPPDDGERAAPVAAG